MPRPPANPVVRARPTHVATTLARIESACRSFIIPSSHAGASLLRLPLELRQADPDHQRTGRLTDHQHRDRKSTRLNSSHGYISYAVFCLKKKKKHNRILSRWLYVPLAP